MGGSRDQFPQNNQPAPNVSNVVGQAGQIGQGINSNLTGSTGAPDITQLVHQVGNMGQTQNAAMTGGSPGMIQHGTPYNASGGGWPSWMQGPLNSFYNNFSQPSRPGPGISGSLK